MLLQATKTTGVAGRSLEAVMYRPEPSRATFIFAVLPCTDVERIGASSATVSGIVAWRYAPTLYDQIPDYCVRLRCRHSKQKSGVWRLTRRTTACPRDICFLQVSHTERQTVRRGVGSASQFSPLRFPDGLLPMPTLTR